MKKNVAGCYQVPGPHPGPSFYQNLMAKFHLNNVKMLGINLKHNRALSSLAFENNKYLFQQLRFHV